MPSPSPSILSSNSVELNLFGVPGALQLDARLASLVGNAVSVQNDGLYAVSRGLPLFVSGKTGSQSGTQSIPSATLTAFSFATTNWTRYEEGGTSWNAANPTRVTPPVAGLYLVCAWSAWQGTGGGANNARGCVLRANGATVFSSKQISRDDMADQGVYAHSVGMFQANGTTDYVEVVLWHDLAIAMNAGAGVSVCRVG
jgi:hypothetical protein